MPIELAALFTEIAQLLDTGRALAARDRLRKLVPGDVPHRHRFVAASLARRAGLPAMGLQLLGPLVRGADRSVGGNDRERTLYAACLVRVGASEEALELLALVDERRATESLLFRAHALFSRWDYATAIPLLERFIAASGGDERQHVVGRLNLAAALVHEKRFTEAQPLLERLIDDTARLGLTDFYGNALELSAQGAIGAMEWREARRHLARAEQALRAKGGLEELFVRKWAAICDLAEHGPGRSQRAKLGEVCRDAVAHSHWETIRDCDLALALRTSDSALLLRLYFGTPFESFRKRIFLDCPEPLDIPEFYRWRPTDRPGASTTIDLTSPLTLRRRGLSPLAFRVLGVLVSDFYRPVRVAQLHARLYPGEYFNPYSSPDRVHHAVGGLRRWLAARKLPLDAVAGRAGYRLVASAAMVLRVPKPLAAGRERDTLAPLLRRLPEEFSSADAASALKTSPRSAKRLLRRAVEEKLLECTGAGKATRYSFRRRR